MYLCIQIYIFYSALIIFLPTLPHLHGSDSENMLVLGREEKNDSVLKAVLSTGELDLNSAFMWSSHTMPAM